MAATDTTRAAPGLAARAAMRLVWAYQYGVRPLLLGHCKFCPSCSEYTAEALRLHGLWRGGWLGLRRLLRCHPFTPGGIDPVPPVDPVRD